MNREAEFLSEQAAIAKARLRLHASTLANDLVAPLRVGAFVRQKPWWSLGGALVSGFATGVGLRALTRSRRVRAAPARIKQLVRNAPDRLRRLVRAAPTRIRRIAAAFAHDAHNVLVGALSILAAHLRESARTPAPPSVNGHPHPPSH